jgi:hypothetical protein
MQSDSESGRAELRLRRRLSSRQLLPCVLYCSESGQAVWGSEASCGERLFKGDAGSKLQSAPQDQIRRAGDENISQGAGAIWIPIKKGAPKDALRRIPFQPCSLSRLRVDLIRK